MGLGQSALFGLDPCACGVVGQSLRSQTRGSLAACFRFLFGTAAGFPGCLIFRGNARQGSRFGELLDPRLFGRQFGGGAVGLGPLTRKLGKFIFAPGACRRRTGQLGGGTLPGLNFRQGALFGFDTRAQGGFRKTFGLHLPQGLGFSFGGRTLGLRGTGLALGFQTRDGDPSGFCLLLGTTARFLRCLLFRGYPRQGGACGGLLDSQLFGRPVGGERFGCRAFGSRPCESFVRIGSCHGGSGQFRGGARRGLRRG